MYLLIYAFVACVPPHTGWHGYERDHILNADENHSTWHYCAFFIFWWVWHFICWTWVYSCQWHHLIGVSVANMVWYFNEKCLWVTTVNPTNLKNSYLHEWNESAPVWAFSFFRYINTRYNNIRLHAQTCHQLCDDDLPVLAIDCMHIGFVGYNFYLLYGTQCSTLSMNFVKWFVFWIIH